MQRPDGVEELIKSGFITETHWALYRTACAQIETNETRQIVIGAEVWGIRSIGLDVSKPGVLCTVLMQDRVGYFAWDQLTGVLEFTQAG